MAGPSWYGSAWSYRYPIAIDVSGGVGATFDATAVVPVDFDHFWNNVLASGNDVRVTDSDGITLLTYDLAAGFSTTTRSGTIELDNVTGTTISGGMKVVWLYYGNAAAADARTAFAPSSAKTGYIRLDQPPSARVVKATMERPGATFPTAQVAKVSGDEIDFYVDVTDMLRQRGRPYNSSNDYEGVDSFTYSVTAAKSPVAGTTDATKNRVVFAKGRLYLVCYTKGGTDGATITGVCQAWSSIDPAASFDTRFLIKINDVDEV